uniref:Uncharacterized protein n=1 Tax=Romanomermis culicivorax TaxID=13658 RepID=A0A915HFR8_ROMCU
MVKKEREEQREKGKRRKRKTSKRKKKNKRTTEQEKKQRKRKGNERRNKNVKDPAKNPFDAITINLALSKNDALYESKFQFLTKLGLNKNAFRISTETQSLNNFLHFALIFYAVNNLENIPEKFDFESLDSYTRKKCSQFVSDRLNLLLKVREKALKIDEKTSTSVLNLLDSEKHLLEKAISAMK